MATQAYNAAIAHMQQGRLDAAEQSLRRHLQRQPGDLDSASLLGAVLTQLGRFDNAEFLFKRAMAADPSHYAVRGNYGNMLLFAGRFAEAKEQFEAALRLSPDGIEALLGLGPVLYSLGDLDGAIGVGRRAREVAPGDPAGAANLGASLTAAGLVSEATRVLRDALAIAPQKPSLVSNYLGALNYMPDVAPETIYREHVRVAHWLGHDSAVDERPAPRRIAPGQPLRVGLVSADLRTHAVAYFLEPILRHADQARVQFFAYFNGTPDAVSERLRPMFAGWFPCLGVSDSGLAAKVKADQIDVLIDLSGHTDGSRLSMFRRRPAAVQATYLGYPNTTGLPSMDYRLTDAIADPPRPAPQSPAVAKTPALATPTPEAGCNADGDYASERLVRLPRCFLCYSPPSDVPPVAPPPAQAAGAITFGCFNASSKINAKLVATWVRVLRAVPGSRLVIKHRGLAGGLVREATEGWLAAGGLQAEERQRVELVGWVGSFREHLAAYGRIDIALDSLPYNGTTTTCEALLMGVPVVTTRGSTHAARVSASLLSAVGLSELIAHGDDGYVRLAAQLAGDPARLDQYRRTLRDRLTASPLCDGPAMARAFEDACWHMFTQTASAVGG